VALGFNGLTLKVLGKLRYVVTINLLAAAVNVLINLLLIPRFGALGAAVGTAGTMVVHNILKQRITSCFRHQCFRPKYFPFYGLITLCAGGLLLLIRFFHAGGIYVALPLIGLTTLLVFRASRHF